MHALVVALALLVAAPLGGQGQSKKLKPNDPSTDPYSQNDPALLKAAGIVSLGGFDFGKSGSTTEKIDEFMSTSEIRWIETEHFKIGFGLGSYKVKLDEKKKIVAELTKLKAFFPKVAPDTGILDPWLRTHMYAQRCEAIYKRFVELVHGEKAAFNDGTGQWQGAYSGEGPYLGQKAKYEILILQTEAAHVSYLLEQAGLRIRKTQRWHFVDKGAITVMMHAQQGQLRNDGALHGHVAFNLAHNLYDGLNHYSYDTPVWLHEGLAHFMEREIDPQHNSFDSGEGATADMTSKANWKPEVLKMINSGEAPRMAELMTLKSYAELKLEHHYVTWSMVDYLARDKPEPFAKFLWALKRNYDKQGMPTGDSLPDWVRKQFKEQLGMSYAEFDEAWRAWCKVDYTAAPGKDKDKDKAKSDPAAGKEAPQPKGDPVKEGGKKEDPAGGG
jgi:hypothetical protein